MGENSKIEWTDTTWNVSVGCTLMSPGCVNCYAMGAAAGVLRKMKGSPTSEKTAAAIRLYEGVTRQAKREKDGQARPVWTERVNLCTAEVLNRPLHWKRPRRVFVNSMSDLFHKDIPEDFLEDVFYVMKQASQHQFQVLTKRPDRAAAVLNKICPAGTPPNVWIGTSAENKATLEQRVPELLKITPRPAVLFLSAEPLIGPFQLGGLPRGCAHWKGNTISEETIRRQDLIRQLDWVIVGGESGPRARQMKERWVWEIEHVCRTRALEPFETKKTAFFFKQWGEWNQKGERVGKKKAGRLLDGREWNEMPEGV